jgi:putative SOS response-associated peptidase YedK
MCGRFTLTKTPQALDHLFPSLFDSVEVPPQYNVAPSQNVLAVRLRPGNSEPEAVRLRWGLIPAWADDPKIGYRMINARAETARDKPAFRSAFKSRHCLILADGFYEWQKCGKQKQPYHIRFRDGRPFGFAGLWERWHHEGQVLETCTILTTDANEVARPVHDRMPVILTPDNFQAWLDTSKGTDGASELLRPCSADDMIAVPVSTHVNNPRNNDAACLEPPPPAPADSD